MEGLSRRLRAFDWESAQPQLPSVFGRQRHPEYCSPASLPPRRPARAPRSRSKKEPKLPPARSSSARFLNRLPTGTWNSGRSQLRRGSTSLYPALTLIAVDQ